MVSKNAPVLFWGSSMVSSLSQSCTWLQCPFSPACRSLQPRAMPHGQVRFDRTDFMLAAKGQGLVVNCNSSVGRMARSWRLHQLSFAKAGHARVQGLTTLRHPSSGSNSSCTSRILPGQRRRRTKQSSKPVAKDAHALPPRPLTLLSTRNSVLAGECLETTNPCDRRNRTKSKIQLRSIRPVGDPSLCSLRQRRVWHRNGSHLSRCAPPQAWKGGLDESADPGSGS